MRDRFFKQQNAEAEGSQQAEWHLFNLCLTHNIDNIDSEVRYVWMNNNLSSSSSKILR